MQLALALLLITTHAFSSSAPPVPVVWTSNPVLPNDTALVRTAGSNSGNNFSSLQLCAASGSASGSAPRCEPVQLLQPWSQGFKFVVPPDMPLGAWFLMKQAGSNTTLTRLNDADPW